MTEPHEQQAILLQRLKEKELSLDRFLKVGPDKAAFEADFQNKPYGPADLASDKPCFCKYCQGKQSHNRWGILGKDFLVLVDTDKKEMYDLLSKVLPETFEVTSPRRGLPHKYFCVCGEQVPNKTLYIVGDVDEKGRPNGAGEVRANNEYLVAPGTVIAYKDKLTGEEKTGMYLVSKNVPIARLEYSDFMAAVKPYFGKNQSQTITPEEMANGVSAGMRHAKGIRYACHLIGKAKLDAETAFFEMQRWNQLNNSPMDEKDLKRQVRDACRYVAEQNQIPIEQVIGCGGIKNPIFEELDADEQHEGNREKTKPIIPADIKKVTYTEAQPLLEKGYEVTKKYAETVVVEKKAVDPNQQTPADKKPKESQADRLYKLFLETDVELFHDQNGTEFAQIPNSYRDASDAIDAIPVNSIASNKAVNEGGKAVESVGEAIKVCENGVNCVIASPKEIVRLRDMKFQTYLSHLLYEAEKKVANTESKSQVIQLLKYDALHGKYYKLFNRVAPDPSGDGSIWLDMADVENRAYHITKTSWTVETNVPILFRRFDHQKPLAAAIHGGDPKLILPFVNIGANKNSELTRHRQLLLLVQTASYGIPNISHPVNAMFGCPGSHKSTAQRFIRGVFDPSSAPLLGIPRDENAALQVLDHHYIPIFDNLEYLPLWFSAMLSKAVTGTGQESRALYTDDDSFIRAFKRCIMLNGLNLPATKGDLLNRTIIHPTEPNVQRRTDEELDAAYNKVLPEILGGFLDVIVKALNHKETIKPSKLFRLADFTEWGCALAVALGETVEDFIAAMEENLGSQNDADIENNIVADAFLAYVKGDLSFANATEEKPIVDTPDKVFSMVTATASSLNMNTKSKRWPTAACYFTRKLNDSKNAIIANGWTFEVTHHKGSKREMAIWKTEDELNLPEPKRYCSVECGNYENPNRQCRKYGNLNQMSEMPCKCPEYVKKAPKKKYVCDRCSTPYFKNTTDGKCNATGPDGVCEGNLKEEEF